MDLRRFELNGPAVIAEAIEGEVMVMNLQQGIYYSVTGAAAVAWPLLVGGATCDAVTAAIAGAYNVPATQVGNELGAFVQRLLDEAILRAAADEAPGSKDIALPAVAMPYPGFGFERFDDMRAMLVIDPVHEVGDFGWPQAAGPKAS
jgi:hypothetical protein